MSLDLPRPIPWLEPTAPAAAPSAPERPRVRLPVLQTTVTPGGRPEAAPSKTKPGKRGFFGRLFHQPPRPGSGLPARPWIRRLVMLRRLSQTVFFGLFVWLLLRTALRAPSAFSSGEKVRLSEPVEIFFWFDPFVGLITSLASHRLYAGLLWSLSIVLLTLVFGRVFCGWICPMGTLQHGIAFLFPSAGLKGTKRLEKNRYRSWQRLKYALLAFFVAAAATGSAIGGLFDPIAALFRALALGVLPILQYVGLRAFASRLLERFEPTRAASDGALETLGEHVWTTDQAYFHGAWLVVLVFVAFVLVVRAYPRFFCRFLCPLGAMLGVISRYALFGLAKDHHKCTDCNLCVSHCQGADAPEGGVKHQAHECHACFNCEVACPEDVLEFRFFPNAKSRTTEVDLSRRATLGTAALGAALVPTSRIAEWPDRGYSPKVIRPPGALPEREFLETCIRCAECMKVCPNNALHPALFEAGPEGLWTPILIPRIGYCEHSCVLCGQVCPTGAIEKIEEKHKLGQGVPPVRIGTAMFDHGRCLPWAMATPCTVCEEFCPTSPKAIWVTEEQVPRRTRAAEVGVESSTETVSVKRPHVDPALCIGCGACEKVCPVVDQPAVYVTSAGESRSKTNVILLEDTAYGS